MWLKDPRDNKKSVSVTLLVYVTAIAVIKWLVADKFLGSCSASDVAVLVGPFLTNYFAQRSVWAKDSGNAKQPEQMGE